MKNFDKYSTRGPDYHYRQIDRKSLRNYSAPVHARFETLVEKVRKIAEKKSLKILDVGCGDGVALYLLSRKLQDIELYGIDPVPKALETAKGKVPKAHFSHGTSDLIPFRDQTFDIIISSDVIEHVDDSNKMLSEVKRVAKEGATVIVGTPIRHSKFPIDHNHVQEFFAEDFLEMMRKYFKDCELHESHNLATTLLYNNPTRSFINFKYLVNLLSLIFKWNPFKAERRNKVQMFAYMYVICKK